MGRWSVAIRSLKCSEYETTYPNTWLTPVSFSHIAGLWRLVLSGADDPFGYGVSNFFNPEKRAFGNPKRAVWCSSYPDLGMDSTMDGISFKRGIVGVFFRTRGVAGTVGFSCMGVGTMALVDGYFAECHIAHYPYFFLVV